MRNLIALTTGATLGELASLEEIIAQFMKSGDLTKACITLLWEKFTLALPDTTAEEAKASLVLLSMAANSEPSIVHSNIGVLIKSGLGERGEQDFSLVAEVCLALSKIAVTKPKTDDPNPPFRLEQHHELFGRLSSILVEGITRENDCQYSPMAQQAINAIYSLAEHPDLICEDIIRRICGKMAEKSETDEEKPDLRAVTLPTFVLARFLVLTGRVAIRQLVHLDTFIFSELKRRNHAKEEHETVKKSKKSKGSKRKSLMASAFDLTGSRGSSQDDDNEDELGLMGAVADDMEAEYIRSVCDKEIFQSGNMLSLILPLIVDVCSNPTKYCDRALRAAACFALSNCMMVSSDICENNLQLLFTILEKSDDPIIRGNTIIALGDLSFRFPNLVEPWTPRLYARLTDSECSVRLNAMTVLTHLILNDMVKVKGQISDIALCITDLEHRISGMAKLFFTELSRKQNALYNVLPDIISRLSDPDTKLEEAKYRLIISHIFGLIQKDRQVEGLVEKLCHRLQATTSPRQWRDITHCLALLPFNDKSLRKLSDLFCCYADKLHEPDVHKMFLAILAKARKFGKQEAKAMLDELEGKIEKSHDKGVEEQSLVDKALAAKEGRTARQRPARASLAGKKKRREESSESEEEELTDSEEEHPALCPKKEQTKRASIRERREVRRGGVLGESSEEESNGSSDSEEAKSPPVKRNTRMTRRR